MTKNSKVRTMVGLTIGAAVVGIVAVGVSFAQQPAGPASGGMMGRGARMGACGPMMGGRGPMGGPLMGIRRGLARLGLTDQQKTQIKAIFDGHKTDIQGLAARMKTARQALDAAIWSGADETTIRAKAADVAAVQADMAVLRATIHTQVFAVLTPDQQAKANQLHQQGPWRRMGGRKGPGF
jgi:periplasmic protein CpxP/Spy